MHLLTLLEDTYRYGDSTLIPKGKYLVEDLTAFEMGVAAERGMAQIVSCGEVGQPEADSDRSNTLIVHPGGYGDLLMLGPALRAFKRAHPKGWLTVSARERVQCLFEGLAYPDAWAPYPLPIDERFDKYTTAICLENLNEAGEEGRTMHAIDLKAKRLGVDLAGDTKVEFALTEAEIKWAQDNFPRRSDRRIGVQLAASAPNRSPSSELLGQLMSRLYKEGWDVYIFGSPGSTDSRPVPPRYMDRVTDLAMRRLTVRQSAAVLSQLDVAVAPDSLIVHLCGALGVKCIALFGPIGWKQRTAYYPTVRAIQAHGGCEIAPCWFHPRGGIFWPRNGPCATSGRCEPLAHLTCDQVYEAVRRIMTK